VSTVDESPSPLQGEGWGEGSGGGESTAFDGAAALAAVAATGCTAPLKQYTAIRLGYAANGRAVTFVHDESWCWDGNPANCPTNYTVTYAREFRYDGARARYMNRQLNPSTLATVSTIWSDYDGDETYGDFTASSTGVVTNTNKYEPGLWRRVAGVSDYLHSDMLGTLRQTTGSTGGAGASRVFTAFGERQAGSSDRFGYVGAWGYQSNPIPESPNPDTAFPFLHVGARYYDPSSGRFLQRDPIGILGGSNVYGYVKNRATLRSDPTGLDGPFCGGPCGCLPCPPGPPKPESPEDIAKQLQDERFLQIVAGACILAGAFAGTVAAVIAAVLDLAATVYASNDPTVVPTNAPNTAPGWKGGPAG
jgi:RHS repeat-associated protein